MAHRNVTSQSKQGGAMGAKDKREDSVFRPSAASRLLDGGGEDLTDDERALLLALIGVDAQTEGGLAEEDRAALDELKAQVQGYDVDELAQAVQHMVTAKPQENRKLKWPTLKRRRGKRPPKE